MTATIPTVTQQAKEPETDKSSLKIFVIGLLGTVSVYFATFRFTEFLSFLTPMNAFLAFISVSGFFVIAVLQAFFVKSPWRLLTICVIEVLGAGAFFWKMFFPIPSYPLIAGMILFLGFLYFGAYEGSRFLSQALSIRFSFVSRGILARSVTGFLLFLAAVSYVWYFNLGKFNPNDGYELVAGGIFSGEPILHIWFPGASLDQTAEVFFRKVAEAEYRKIPRPNMMMGSDTYDKIDFNILNKQQQELLIQGTSETLRVSFEKALGIPISKDALLKDVLYSFLTNKIENFSDRTSDYFGIVVASFIFFSLKGIFMSVGWFIRFITFLIYRLLLVFGFAYVSVETRNREFILLS